MTTDPAFIQASPYQKDVLALPVEDVDAASKWYSVHFGMQEISRVESPVPTVVLERNGVQIGFAVNGGDATQDGAAIRVQGIEALKQELLGAGLKIGDSRIDERDGRQFNVFFVVAPDGLCFYFHEPVSADSAQ